MLRFVLLLFSCCRFGCTITTATPAGPCQRHIVQLGNQQNCSKLPLLVSLDAISMCSAGDKLITSLDSCCLSDESRAKGFGSYLHSCDWVALGLLTCTSAKYLCPIVPNWSSCNHQPKIGDDYVNTDKHHVFKFSIVSLVRHNLQVQRACAPSDCACNQLPSQSSLSVLIFHALHQRG